MLCASCFKGIKDPFVFLPRALDPTSDRRLMTVSSSTLIIGPTPSRGLVLGKGPEEVVSFRSSMEGDQREIPGIMDRYLSFLGIGIRLRGDERIPRRDILSDFLEATLNLDYDLLPWARASIRMGNLATLVVRRIAFLSIEEGAKKDFLDLWSERAKGMYERGDAFPQLRWAALSNQALLEHWCGDHDQALSLIDYVMKKNLSQDDVVEARIKKATILFDLRRFEEAKSLLELVAGEGADSRVNILMSEMEGDE